MSSSVDTIGPAGRRASPVGSRSRSDVLALLATVTPRDRNVLAVLAEHQVLTTGQLADFAFPSLHVAQRRMLLLTRRELVDRFRWHTPRGSQA